MFTKVSIFEFFHKRVASQDLLIRLPTFNKTIKKAITINEQKIMRQVYLFASLLLLPSAANGLHTRTSWSKGDLSSALRPAGVPLATFEDCEVGECDVESVLGQMWARGAYDEAAAQRAARAPAAAAAAAAAASQNAGSWGIGERVRSWGIVLDSLATFAVAASGDADDRLATMLSAPEEVHELATDALLTGSPLDAIFPSLQAPPLKESSSGRSYHLTPDVEFQRGMLHRAEGMGIDYLSGLESLTMGKVKARK